MKKIVLLEKSFVKKYTKVKKFFFFLQLYPGFFSIFITSPGSQNRFPVWFSM